MRRKQRIASFDAHAPPAAHLINRRTPQTDDGRAALDQKISLRTQPQVPRAIHLQPHSPQVRAARNVKIHFRSALSGIDQAIDAWPHPERPCAQEQRHILLPAAWILSVKIIRATGKLIPPSPNYFRRNAREPQRDGISARNTRCGSGRTSSGEMNSIALEQEIESLASRAVLHDRIGLPAIHFKRQRNPARPRTKVRRAQSNGSSRRRIGAARRRPLFRTSHASSQRNRQTRRNRPNGKIE